MIKTVIFDMGQVLIHWSGKQLLQRFSLRRLDCTSLRQQVQQWGLLLSMQALYLQ